MLFRSIPPSPNMKTLQTATVYPGTCMFEATSVSEGRGTEKPFEYIGAPWINSKQLIDKLNRVKLSGVEFESIHFTPKVDSVSAPNPKYKNEQCEGVYVKVTNRKSFRPIKTGLVLFRTINELYSSTNQTDTSRFKLQTTGMEHLLGVHEMFKLRPSSQQFKKFLKLRHKYLLYK